MHLCALLIIKTKVFSKGCTHCFFIEIFHANTAKRLCQYFQKKSLKLVFISFPSPLSSTNSKSGEDLKIPTLFFRAKDKEKQWGLVYTNRALPLAGLCSQLEF